MRGKRQICCPRVLLSIAVKVNVVCLGTFRLSLQDGRRRLKFFMASSRPRLTPSRFALEEICERA